jgi:amidophosphoribosyltransferase
MELITRKVICELEGIDRDGFTQKMLGDYSNPDTDRYKAMSEKIRDLRGFNSLEYQRLDDTLESVGIDKCKLCTYCWNGKE